MNNIIDFSSSITIENALNNIIHGDCLEVMKSLPDKCIDVIITSPPYNLRDLPTTGLGSTTTSSKWQNASLRQGYDCYEDNMPYPEYVQWQKECVGEMVRLLKDDGAIFYNNKNRTQNGLLQDRGEIVRGYPVRQIITWKRKGGFNFNDGYFLPTTEQIYLICNKKFKLSEGTNRYTDVWEITQEMKNPHPAPFPEELTDRIVSCTTGQIILDPFGGSGTTAVSAQKFNRNYILIEQSQKYCELAQSRLNKNINWRQNDNSQGFNCIAQNLW